MTKTSLKVKVNGCFLEVMMDNGSAGSSISLQAAEKCGMVHLIDTSKSDVRHGIEIAGALQNPFEMVMKKTDSYSKNIWMIAS